MSDESDGEKPYAATEKKKEKVKRDGHFTKADELRAYLPLLIITTLIFTGNLLDNESLKLIIEEQDPRYAVHVIKKPLMAISALTITFTLAALALSFRSIAFKNIKPRIEKISLLSNLKNKLSRSQLTNLSIKIIISLCMYLSIFAIALNGFYDNVYHSSYSIQHRVEEYLLPLAFIIFIHLSVTGFFTLTVEILRIKSKMMMSHKEVKDEIKEGSGDANIKSKIKSFLHDLIRNANLPVKDCSVIITNPTHYSVGIYWDRNSKSPPICWAKGANEVALRIRSEARARRIAIHRAPPLARELFSTYKVGQEINPRHYRAVAAAIIFADGIKADKSWKN